MSAKILLYWSSGKDSAWALETLRRNGDFDVVGLVTNYNAAANRVAMHSVRRELVQAQARAADLPLSEVELPWPCSNAIYELKMREIIAEAASRGITHFAFGDLFLDDIRDYRCRQLAGTGIEPLFPVWGTPQDTSGLARQMLAGGLRAVLTCVDSRQIDGQFAGREFDERLIADLPPGADPCGERGEFHTFCYAGPMFSRAISVQVGDRAEREGFCFADVIPR